MRVVRQGILFALLAATTASAGTLEDARALMAAGRGDEAQPLLERAATDPALAGPALEMLTELANAREDHEQGVRWGKRAVDVSPASSNAHFQYAVALRTKMQQVSKVRAMMSLGDYKKELERAIELDPQNVHAREEQIGFLSEAPGIAGGSVERARELAQELRKIDRQRGTFMLARVERKAGQPDRAIALYRELLVERPSDPLVRSVLAATLLEQKHWPEADEQFALLAASEDEKVALPAIYQRARTRIVGKYELEQAVAFLEDYLERAAADAVPPPSSAWWRMGNAYEQLGRAPDARRAYQESLRLNPDDKQAKEALASLSGG